MGKGNEQMVGGGYHYIMMRSFDFILGTAAAALWKDFDLHRKGIYAILSEGKNNKKNAMVKPKR